MTVRECCGSVEGWQRHDRARETPCDRCVAAQKAHLEKVAAMRGGRVVRKRASEVAHLPQSRPANCTLTLREWEVAVLVAEGLSNPEIAGRLGISADTVKSHVRSALAELGVTSRSALAGAVYRRGWLPLDLVEGEPLPVPRELFESLGRLVHLVHYGRVREAQELARRLSVHLPTPKTYAP